MIFAVTRIGQKAPALKTTQFPDGTGSIGVAPGWKLGETYRGSCSLSGPGDTAVVLGIPWAILRPDSSVASLPAGQQTPMANPGDLATALREVITKRAQARLTSLRMRPAPSATPNVPAAQCMYEYELNGKIFSALGYLTTLDYGASSPAWQLYASAVIAPKPRFMKELPTMLAVWKSWRPNGQAPKAGSESAKFDEMMQKNRENYDKMQAEFRKLL